MNRKQIGGKMQQVRQTQLTDIQHSATSNPRMTLEQAKRILCGGSGPGRADG